MQFDDTSFIQLFASFLFFYALKRFPGKGFDWPMIDTGTFFNSIKAKYV